MSDNCEAKPGPVEYDGGEYRIWSAANHKCLTLKKIGCTLNVACVGTGDETGIGAKGSSKSQLFIFVVFACFLGACLPNEIQYFAAIL